MGTPHSEQPFTPDQIRLAEAEIKQFLSQPAFNKIFERLELEVTKGREALAKRRATLLVNSSSHVHTIRVNGDTIEDNGKAPKTPAKSQLIAYLNSHVDAEYSLAKYILFRTFIHALKESDLFMLARIGDLICLNFGAIGEMRVISKLCLSCAITPEYANPTIPVTPHVQYIMSLTGIIPITDFTKARYNALQEIARPASPMLGLSIVDLMGWLAVSLAGDSLPKAQECNLDMLTAAIQKRIEILLGTISYSNPLISPILLADPLSASLLFYFGGRGRTLYTDELGIPAKVQEIEMHIMSNYLKPKAFGPHIEEEIGILQNALERLEKQNDKLGEEK